MAKTCSHEGCKYARWGGGYCKIHQYLRTDKKVKKSISPFSEKMLENLKVYKVVRAEYLESHPRCQANINGCKKEASDIHHTKGRNGSFLTDKSTFMAVCRPCHIYIETHPDEAREKGWIKVRV